MAEPLSGKYGRVNAGGVSLEFAGEWRLTESASLLETTNFENAITLGGKSLVQKMVGLTEVTGTVSGRFQLDQIPSDVNIVIGNDAEIELDLIVKKPDIGVTVSVVLANSELGTVITDGANFSWGFHVNSIVAENWS
jgi:hypothetical protein